MSISAFEVIKDKDSWQEVLDAVEQYDFYHTFDYHQISKLNGEIPILVKYQENNTIVALPFLLRRIYNTEYYDLTSVYGYSGPITTKINKDFDSLKLKKHLVNYFIEHNIVAIFSRLNPFISNQEKIIEDLGEIKRLSKVVNIDLCKSLDEQRTVFSKTTKRYINKTRKLCDVRIGNSPEDMESFRSLYYENMDRVNAKKSYYFDKQYFKNFVASTAFKTDVLLVVLKETGETISAAMMVKTNDIIQYHISGTKNDYLHLTPIRLLIDEMRIAGTKDGYKFFNLGGGLGSSEDSLFNFKASFSKDFKDFKVWKYIANQEIYDSLCTKYAAEDSNSDFFPLYRSKA